LNLSIVLETNLKESI